MEKNVINVTNKLKQKTIINELKNIDWSSSSKSPYIVEFDPTTKCNLACPDCISGELLNQDEFSNDRVLELTQEMIDAGVKGVILIGGGEPMAHPKIGEVINLLGQNNVAIGITTNGLYLKKHLESITKYVSWIRVSMDAASPEVFQSIRPSRTGDSMFDLVIENMKSFSKNKRKDQILGYSFMVYSKGDYGFKGVPLQNDKAVIKIATAKDLYTTNADEIYKAAIIAKEIGCAYLEIKPMYDSNHFSVMQKQIISDLVEEQIEKAKTLEDENFKIIEATKLRSSLRGEGNYEPKKYTRCAVSQLRTLVTPSGVYVCPYFRGVDHKKIGDVNNQSFIEMWHGEKRRNIMNKLDPSIDCPMHCIRNDSNIFIEENLNNNFNIDSTEIVEDYDRFI
jgi:MoaA/NifB/PqqE/SkfB family radical SAM enzyme